MPFISIDLLIAWVGLSFIVNGFLSVMLSGGAQYRAHFEAVIFHNLSTELEETETLIL